MKMVYGNGTTIADYQKYVYNYTLGQYNYKLPVGTLGDIILYVPLGEFGSNVPGSITAELIHTCGPSIGTTETITASQYVAGTDTNARAYMVVQGFAETTTAPCFVIGLNLDGIQWFSQEYTFEGCDSGLDVVQSCYGNLDPKISYDREGIYFGQSQGSTVGDSTLVYPHRIAMRRIEITVSNVRNEFKEGRVRNFRTESTDILQFWGDLIPEWYLKHVDAVFKRGEVSIEHDLFSFAETDGGADVTYLLENTAYEKNDDCAKSWKPTVFLKEGFYNSFSCEPAPCAFVPAGGGGGGGTPVCCDPSIISATVESNGEGGQIVCVNFNGCDPSPANAYTIYYRIAGSGGGYTLADTGFVAPSGCFGTDDPDGTQYEGYIFSDCGGGVVGGNVLWSTGAATTVSINLSTPCVSNFSDYIVTGTPGDTITVRAYFSGLMSRIGGSFIRANLEITSPCTPGIVSSTCYVDTASHFFNIQSDCTFVLDGSGTQHVTTLAWVDNSSESASSSYMQILDVNGDAHAETAGGCRGNSSTGGTCP